MDSIGERRDLQELGTRYDHYMELKEVFMLGIEVINGMKFASAGDRETKVKLEGAVDVIDRRLKYLSDYDDKIFTVSREVRAAGIHRPLLLEAGNAQTEQPKDQPSETAGSD